ncbi:MAG: MFS transporter [Nitrococcus mobilis]|nr:MFS transporter [Nitrococcus mobilis]
MSAFEVERTAEMNGLEVDDSAMHRAIAGAAIGNALEWFDFGVYGYFAVTLGQVFFPSHDPTASLLSAFAVFAVAFLARPLGSLFFGPLGDKIGRSGVLVTTILMMSAATFAVGLLPSYEAIGIWSPIGLILLRLIQGFSTGGEYGSAATFIAEYAPDEQRGILTSWLEFGTLGGYALAAILAAVLAASLSSEAMLAWGWRIPFLMAAPMGLFGLYLRLKLEDSPAFKQAQEAGEVAQAPLREMVTEHWRSLLLCIGVVLVWNVAYYTVLKYMPSYLTTRLNTSELQSLLLSLGVLLGMMVLLTFIGRLSDRIGRRPVLIVACLGLLFFSYPAFALMQGGTGMEFVGLAIVGFFVVLLSGTLPATLPAIFFTRVRNGGFTISYNLSTSLFGGTAPFMITYLISLSDSNYIPAYYLMGAAAIAIIPILLIRETAGLPLAGAKALHGSRRPAPYEPE